MKLLLINTFKSIKKKKIQMLAIVSIIVLAVTIYISVNTSLDRIEDRYYQYLDEQNVEYFSFQPKINYKQDVNYDDLFLLDQYELLDQEKMIVKQYKTCLQVKEACRDDLYVNIKYVFEKYGINMKLKQDIIESIAKKHDFSYELEVSKTIKINEIYMQALPYISDNKINKVYLVEGHLPINDNEITILPDFAEYHNLKIGDKYKINDVEYKIVGFTYSPHQIYPLISINVPIFSVENNNIIYMNEKSFGEFTGLKHETFVARYNYEVDFKDRLKMSFSSAGNEDIESESTSVLSKMFEAEEENIEFGMNNMARVFKTDLIQNDIGPNRTFSEAFLYLLLTIASFIVIVIVKKRIDDERLQIGILKALGYNNFMIATSYLIYPIVGVLVGSLIGYGAGILLSNPLAGVYLNYYTVPLDNISLNFNDLYVIVVIPLVILSIVSYITALLTVRKKPLSLLKEGSNLKVNIFSRIVNKMIRLLPFKTRIKYSFAFRSIGKLIIVTMVSFTSGLLIVLTLIGFNLFNNLINEMFNSFSYKYCVSYSQFQKIENSQDDLFLEIKQPLYEINDKQGNLKELKEKEEVTLTGIDTELRYIKVVDENNNNLIKNLHSDNNVVISTRMSEILNINLDDMVIFNINNEKVSFKVIGIHNDYIYNSAYVNRAILSEIYKFNDEVYNVKYSINEKYANMENIDDEELSLITNILNIEDLEKNIKNQFEVFNYVIYVVIFFSSLMALIIIGVIANIVVEENRKTISLMKVLGYKNKDISSIVLNIYTPFIIIAYLLSIPAMIYIIKSIIKAISGDIGVVIPVELSLTHAGLGLVGLVIAYYIGINLSKRVLNKISLAIALKRE